MFTNKEFAEKLIKIANDYKTVYIMGCFGAPMNDKNKRRYSNNNDYNRARAVTINSASPDTFGFDCVCLIKGVLWGWNGDTNKVYGGAEYKSNNVPDIGTEQIIDVCSDVSTDFSKIDVGELLWLSGHVGIYIGDGLAVECTPVWKNRVQITAVANIGTKAGYNSRKWVKHGKLPYITYEIDMVPTVTTDSIETVYTVVAGDTLSKIAEKYNTTYQRLAEYNNIENPSLIFVGQKIKIPGTDTTHAQISTITKIYTVKDSDTLWNIAKRYLGKGSRYTEIMELNGLKNNVIRAGQILKIPVD